MNVKHIKYNWYIVMGSFYLHRVPHDELNNEFVKLSFCNNATSVVSDTW